ncbi:MAG TPA: sulfatase-like hydrolase/transferase [Thermoanaerobaculia bacterium]|jgi:arylsulfatase A-like enzyme/thioredoxin-like negative regulator of GroEL|nr:sulfatase-like hydrolase/transferase [Thermoanaerobaculia bacterium]
MRLRTTVVLAAFAAIACRHEQPALRFPNAPVILISVDTLRADHLPAYGHAGVATPNIDALRRDGTLFRNAYAAVPMTLPSHVTMLTGLLPPEHGVRDNVGFRFDAKAHPSIASVLKNAGYATGGFISSYVLRGGTGLSDAFDFYEDSIEGRPGARFVDYQRPGNVTAALAEKWVDERGDKPFFLFFHIYEPHVPYDPPEPFRSRYAASPYDGEIATADGIVGDLLNHLKQRGVYDRAIILFVSDHGEGLGDHGEKQHSILVYRELIHVPLIVKLPHGARAGGEVREPATLADLFATVTSLAGTPNVPKTSGLPLFEKLPAARPIYSESLYARLHLGWSGLRSVTNDARQLIESSRSELYDINADPTEKHDLASSDRRTANGLREKLAQFPAGESVQSAITAEEKAKLTALGYVASPAASAQRSVNPADRIGDIEELQDASRLATSDMASAGKKFRDLLAKEPAMVEAWVQFGDALLHAGDVDGAIDSYRNAIARSSGPLPDVLLSLASAYLQKSDTAHAMEAARAAMPFDPRAAHSMIALAALAIGDTATAESEAATIERPHATDLVLRAEIAAHQNRFNDALALLDQAAAMERDVYRLHFVRGDVFARMNRNREAIEEFRTEIAKFPNDLDAYERLAFVLVIAGDSASASRALDEMVAANPTPAARRLAAETRKALRQ